MANIGKRFHCCYKIFFHTKNCLVLICEGILFLSSLLSGTMNCLFRLSWMWHINLSLKCHQSVTWHVIPRLFGISEMRQQKKLRFSGYFQTDIIFFSFKRWNIQGKILNVILKIKRYGIWKMEQMAMFFSLRIAPFDILINSPEKLTVCVVDCAQWGRYFETYFTRI